MPSAASTFENHSEVRFAVVITDGASEDLNRLTDALLDRAKTDDDVKRAWHALQTVRPSIQTLAESALRCRKAGDGRDPYLRELVIPFGRAGYLKLFEIIGDRVIVAALRHQLEDDYG